MGEPALRLSGVGFAYGGEEVLRAVDLTVPRGQFLAVIGPNGGGKTTLMKLLLGLLEPTHGTIEVLGAPPGAQRSRVAYVPQHTTLRPGFPVSVLEVVLMGVKRETRKRFGHSPEDLSRAMEAIARVGLAGREGRRFGELSGGQMQRALIARALVSGADLLLLDEPTANVDPQGSFCLYDFLCTLGDEQDLTILTVSHDLSILGSRIHAIACVNRRLLYTPAPVLTDEMLQMLYGAHEHTCAMDDFMRTVSAQFGPGRVIPPHFHGPSHGPSHPHSEEEPHA
jgi:zinc transport system ATP-binding protein